MVEKTIVNKTMAERIMDSTQHAVFWGLGRTTYRFNSTVSRDLPYGEHQRQKLDLYIPNGREVKGHAVFIHGGTWRSGHKDEYAYVGQSLAAHGIATAVVGYRLFPEVRFPAFANDIACALAWLEQNGKRHGFDTTSGIVTIGHSAGAHLASLVPMDESYGKTFGFSASLVKGVVGIAGIYSFRAETSALMSDIFQPAAVPNNFFEAKPINYLKPKGIPLRLIHGRKDQTVACRSAERMFKNALLADHPVDIHVEERYGHVRPIFDFVPAMPNHKRFVNNLTRFIDEVTNENTGDRSNRVCRSEVCETTLQSS